jgi:hypothetical protein
VHRRGHGCTPALARRLRLRRRRERGESGGSGSAAGTPAPPAPGATNTGGDDTPPISTSIAAYRPVDPKLHAALRFLEHATFGPTPASVLALQDSDPARWIDAQCDLSASQIDASSIRDSSFDDPAQYAFTAQRFYTLALTAPDQLRLRTAWALSQLLVVLQSRVSGFAQSKYFNLLQRRAFGSYKELLRAVTLHASMGFFQDNVLNRRAGVVPGATPTENHARELMQLFSIGMVELNPDGTPRLDAACRPIATYTQKEVDELARALTGWEYDVPPNHRIPGTPLVAPEHKVLNAGLFRYRGEDVHVRVFWGGDGGAGWRAAGCGVIRSAHAADYRALVCVFLNGSAGGTDRLVPLDTRHDRYAAIRGSLAIPRDTFVPIAGSHDGGRYGMHPGLRPLVPLFDAGRLAWIANGGPLLRPMGLDEAREGRDDQSGWRGRAIEALPRELRGALANVSLTDRGNWSTGVQLLPRMLRMQSYSRHWGSDLIDEPRYPATVALNAMSKARFTDPVDAVYARTFQEALEDSALLDWGSFDSHGNQRGNRNNGIDGQLAELGAALAAFDTALRGLGVPDSVTSFVMTDMGRTLQPAGDGGTDHSWGNHWFAFGDAVKGGRIHGR